MSAYSDDQLVMEALGDSHPAFEQLVEQYQYRVLRTIASIVSDEQAAQDVAQETFLSAWSNLAKLRERHKFGRWLNQTAINLSKRWLRDQRKYYENTASLQDTVLLLEERRREREKIRQEVWDAIDGLTEDHREAVVLYYISGYSYKEMGEMLSVPVSTIRGRLQKARNQLRKEFLDMVTKLQLEIDSTVHKFLEERAKQDGLSIEALILRLIERYRRDAASPGVVTRLIRDNAKVFISKVSPDGRYLSYVNWDTHANLAIYDLETGESRDITDEACPGKDRQVADTSVWSPDGKQIAYTWSKGSHSRELRIVSIDGSKPRVLCSLPAWDQGYTALNAWSRDGKHILAFRCKRTGEAHNHDIVLVSVADGSIRVLKSLDTRHFWGTWMSLSPDGRYVAYNFPQSEGSPNRDIYLLATDGSHEMTLVEHPADDFAPFWAPGGNRIVFASDRSGSMGIWVLDVVDGKPKGSPQRIKQDLNGMRPLGMTQDGSYYYWFLPRDSDIYMAALNPETGEVATPPEKAVLSFEGFNHWPTFSPDGKNLAYISQRPRGSGYSRVLLIRSLETGEERELSPENIEIVRSPLFSPDGRSIFISTESTLGLDFYQIDIETGAATPVVLSDEQGEISSKPFVSPDGNRMFFKRWNGGIRIYDIETKREWQPDFQFACGEGYAAGMALSPDGQRLAFSVDCDNEWSLQIAPSFGGVAREIFRLGKEEAGSGSTWMPDGRYLLFTTRKDEATELWRIPVEGGDPESLGLIMKKIERLSIHPDGRRIAFTAPGSGRGSEVWAMENFLP